MAEFEPIAGQEDASDQIRAETLVVGGGIAGMTAAIETAETGKKVILVERNPSLGGRVAALSQYFPKLCPPVCGMEINLRRMRINPNVRILTLAELEKVSGSAGNYEVQIRLNPRYVNQKCTCCGECAKVCEIERDDVFNHGLAKTKAIYLPHLMAYPQRYVVDPEYAGDDRMKKCAEVCEYDAIELDMQPRTITANVGAIVWATGWKPYDATKMDKLGFGRYPNVITNVLMERYASENGPTGGRIVRPSDGGEISKIGFVQCAGSRDENHLPYCSAVCCMASLKQTRYLREKNENARATIFYIDIRTTGRLEKFYYDMLDDDKVTYIKGKLASIDEEPASRDLLLGVEDTVARDNLHPRFDMVILATGIVPNTADTPIPFQLEYDQYGFIDGSTDVPGVYAAGCARHPCDVSRTTKEATAAAMKAIQSLKRGD